MDVKQAIALGREYITDLFDDEEIMDPILAEAKFDYCSKVWKITVGFTRPWERVFVDRGGRTGNQPVCSFKRTVIDDATGQPHGVKDRVLEDVPP